MPTKKEILMIKIKEKIKEDPSFKKRLFANPKVSIEELIDEKLPFNIEIFEDTPQKVHLVLDNKPIALQEKELATIAGGWSPWDI